MVEFALTVLLLAGALLIVEVAVVFLLLCRNSKDWQQ